MKKKQLLFYICLILLVGLFFLDRARADGGIVINNGDYSVKVRQVNLKLGGITRPLTMMISNRPDLSDGNWEPFKSQKVWYLEYNKGTKTVYIQYKDIWGQTSPIFSDTIELVTPDKISFDFSINNGAKEANTRGISINIKYSEGVESYRVSNSNDFGSSDSIVINNGIVWYLTPGNGEKTVYVQFKDINQKTTVISRKITYIQPDRSLTEGTLLKTQIGTIYYFGFDGKIHPFTSLSVYLSWFRDFKGLMYISSSKLKQYAVGRPVCMRPGTWLVKFKGFPKIYAVEPGCILKPMMSEAEAYLIYGAEWSKRIIELNNAEESTYSVRQLGVNQENEIDVDRDGVLQKVEEDYGSSDTEADTDHDGLSDYEEIYFWYSDPTVRDTDGDGIMDGTEIKQGTSPAGSGKLDFAPDGTYEYPRGSIMNRKADGKYYYRDHNGRYCFISKNPTDSTITDNRFPVSFIISSLVEIKFNPINCRMSNNENEIKLPTVSNFGFITLL